MSSEPAPSLFVPLDLHERFNAGRDVTPGRWSQGFGDALGAIPDGQRRFWGVPFHLGPAGAPCWVLLGAQDGAVAEARVPWEGPSGPGYLIFLHLGGLSAEEASGGGGGGAWRQAGGPARRAGPPSLSRAGEQVATYVLEYGDGSEHPQAVRWRFEINAAGPPWGQKAFAARTLVMDAPVEFRGPYPRNGWGFAQTSVSQSHGAAWLYALPNPHPQRPVRAVRLEGSATATVAVAGITAFFGQEHPLRHRRLQSFRVTLPEAVARIEDVKAEVDLGVIARTYAVPAFDPDAWLAGEGISAPPARGRARRGGAGGGPRSQRQRGRHPARRRAGRAPARGVRRGAAQSADGALRVEVLAPRNTWLHVTVTRRGGGPGRPQPGALPGPGRALPPALRVPAGGQRQLVRGLRERPQAARHRVRLRGRHLPDRAAGGRGLRRGLQGLRVPPPAPEADHPAGAAGAVARSAAGRWTGAAGGGSRRIRTCTSSPPRRRGCRGRRRG